VLTADVKTWIFDWYPVFGIAFMAGLLAVILIGLIVEAVIFRFIEKHTVQRWGMQR